MSRHSRGNISAAHWHTAERSMASDCSACLLLHRQVSSFRARADLPRPVQLPTHLDCAPISPSSTIPQMLGRLGLDVLDLHACARSSASTHAGPRLQGPP
ncbi:hypothetical protein Micbo1qcDRAFT_160299, partial [Microdochium bolleyi]